MTGTIASAVGAVVIGRNEGLRLQRSITSIIAAVDCLAYVDSGSTDGSLVRAHALGAQVIALDPALPFTAARARNEGVTYLLRLHPDMAFVQLVDGDCEVAPGWLQTALTVLRQHPELAVVFGRRRECHRDRSPYNRLCDMEWHHPAGLVNSCGGDALIRVRALQAVGGYDPTLIAGEEPEMCFRLRQQGWQILCIDHDMTWHDAAMTRFSQFYKRTVRAGHAYAENAWLHGRSPERHQVRNVLSSLCWGFALPVLALVLAWPSHGWSLLLLLIGYGLLFYRIRRFRRRMGDTGADATLYAGYTCLAKFIEPIGMLMFFWKRKLLRRRPALIEYKSPL